MKNSILALLPAILFTVAAFAVSPSGTLPVIYINTTGGVDVTSKDNYINATYYIDPMADTGIPALGNPDNPLELQIRGRGNYTWIGFDKKPYRLKLSKKQNLLGLNSSRHWVLLAHADDSNAFLRNTVGFELSRMVNLPWTPAAAPVEVVLNGDYIGLYFLTENVRVESNRVSVWDYDDEYEDYAKAHPGKTLPWQDIYATGGWLVEIDNYPDKDQIMFQSEDPYVIDKTIRVKYDTPSDYITDTHRQWLLDDFINLDKLISSKDYANCLWANEIDLTNLARFFIVNQIVFNYESFHGSCKMWREQGYDEKWNFGPVWDFGSALIARENKMFFDFGPYSNHWIKAMYQYPEFLSEVKAVYEELRDGRIDELDMYIDTFIKQIRSAAAKDKERWPDYGNNDLTYKAEYVKSLLKSSIKYLDSVWGYSSEEPDPSRPLSDIYLRGSFNGWQVVDSYRFRERSDGKYILRLDKLDGEWKLAGPEWGAGNVDFGMAASGEKVELNMPVKLTYAGKNCALKRQSAENVTLVFDWESKELTVSDDDQMPLTVYFVDTKPEPWDKVYVFTWNPLLCGDWPGARMTETSAAESGIDCDGKIWKYQFTQATGYPTEGSECILFNNGNSGLDAGNQTRNFIFREGIIYCMTGEYSSVDDIFTEKSPEEYYNLQGMKVEYPTGGIYILRKGNRTRKVLIP